MQARDYITIAAALALLVAAGHAQAKTFQVYPQPKAVAAPTRPVNVKDLEPAPGVPVSQPVAPPAPEPLERIVGKTADSKTLLASQSNAASGEPAEPAADAGEAPVPAPVPPLRIIPPPSEILAQVQARQQQPDGMLASWLAPLQAWSERWYELIHTLVMIGLFCFTGLLYLISRGQYKVLRRAVAAAETSSHAAQQSAETAQLASLMQTALERPYVFLESTMQGSVGRAGSSGEPAHFTIKFSFRNHGKTPAIITDLQASGSYWATGYPEAQYAASHTASQGMVISPGDKSSPFTLIFDVDIDDLEKAYNGMGQLLFWGKLLYRDMYGELRETAFCRCYRFDEKAFRLAQAETLNYHT